MSRNTITVASALAVTGLLLLASLYIGDADMSASDVTSVLTGECSRPSWRFIVLESRLPQAVTAGLCGAALAVSGLLLQNVFHNPLADPSVFGISSGAALGAAVVMLLMQGSMATLGVAGLGAVVCAAFAGAMGVTLFIYMLSRVVSGNVLLLVVGLMTGYAASAVITVLDYFATEDGIRAYVMWGMGSFGGVALDELWFMALPVAVGLAVAVLMVKQLNVLMLGDNYAAALGINVRAVRNRALVVAGFMTAVTTAFCGPVAFLGLAVPHVARLLLHTDDYRVLVPSVMIIGAATAMACNMACSLPGTGSSLPVNAITPLVGAPVVIFIVLRRGHGGGSYHD